MAPKDPESDPRMKDVESALRTLSSLEAQANNFVSRGKVALAESKGLSSDGGTSARKLVAALISGAPDIKQAMNRMLGHYKELKNTGAFGTFAKKIKSENEKINKLASISKKYTTLLSDNSLHNELKSSSISFEGMFQYCNQFMKYYFDFAKDLNKIVKFKDDSAGSDPSQGAVEETLQFGASVESMCNNFETRGKAAVKELKNARKGTKDKALQKEYDSSSKAVEALIKSAGQAADEYKAMLKDYSAAKKDGDFAACAVKIKSRAPAFRVVQQHASDLAKQLETVKFKAKSAGDHPSLVGLMNYRKMFEEYYKSFKSAMP